MTGVAIASLKDDQGQGHMPKNLIGLIVAAVLAILTAPLWRQAIPRIGSLASNSASFDVGGSQVVTFACPDGSAFQVQYVGQEVRLTLPIGGPYVLGQTGTDRYSNGEFTFYTQSGLGFVERNEVFAYTNCNPQSPIPTPSPTQSPSPSPTLSPVPSPTLTPIPSPTVTPIPGSVSYSCRDGRRFQVRYYTNQAELYLDGTTYYLSQVPTASGTRYTDGSIVLNTQGNQASIDINGFAVYTDCVGSTSGGTITPSPRPSPPNALW